MMNKESLLLKIKGEVKKGERLSPFSIIDWCSEYLNCEYKVENSVEEIVFYGFGILEEELKSKSRKHPLPTLRYLCYRELKEQGYSDGYIAKRFNRNRSTITHGRSTLNHDLLYNNYKTLKLSSMFNSFIDREETIINNTHYA